MLNARASGILFLGIFGVAWAVEAALRLPASYGIAIAGLAAILLGSLFVSSARLRKSAASQPEPTASEVASAAQADKWLYWVTGAEGILLFLTSNTLINMHLGSYLWPAVALIVGLHFYPLGYAFKLRIYGITATLMSLVAMAAITGLSEGYGSPQIYDVAVGLGSAAILWATCGLIIWDVRGRVRAAAGSSPRRTPAFGENPTAGSTGKGSA